METHVSSQNSHCGTGVQIGVGTGFVWSASVSPVNVITLVLRTHPYIYH